MKYFNWGKKKTKNTKHEFYSHRILFQKYKNKTPTKKKTQNKIRPREFIASRAASKNIKRKSSGRMIKMARNLDHHKERISIKEGVNEAKIKYFTILTIN